MDSKLVTQFQKSLSGMGLIYIFSIGLSFLLVVLLARILGPSQFGQYSFVISLISLLSLPMTSGLPQFLTRQFSIAKLRDSLSLAKSMFRLFLLWDVFFSLVIVIVLVTTDSFQKLLGPARWHLIPFVILLIPLRSIQAGLSGSLKGLGRPIAAETVNLALGSALTVAILGAMALTDGFNTGTALAVQASVGLVSIALLGLLYLGTIRRSSIRLNLGEKDYSNWIKSITALTLVGAIGAITAQSGIFFLGILKTDESVAAFRVAERCAYLVSIPISAVNLLVAPAIAKSWESKDLSHLQSLITESAKTAILVAVIIAAPLLLFGEAIIDIVFGEEFSSQSYTTMAILVSGQLINVAMGPVWILLLMCGHERHALRGNIVGLLLTTGLMIALVPKFGQIGAAVATSIGFVVWNTILYRSVAVELKINASFFSLGKRIKY